MQRMVKFQEISILKFLSNNANSGEHLKSKVQKSTYKMDFVVNLKFEVKSSKVNIQNGFC